MLLGPDRREAVGVAYASSDVTSLLGATPVIGRFFRSEEDRESQNVVKGLLQPTSLRWSCGKLALR